MKTFTIELTAKEIEALQICLCAEKLNLEKEINILEILDKTGAKANLIERKRNCMAVCDSIFDKLYEAENNRG